MKINCYIDEKEPIFSFPNQKSVLDRQSWYDESHHERMHTYVICVYHYYMYIHICIWLLDVTKQRTAS